ncbi:unnamed protein product [Bursaphelenchus okinawaensis]|uniref:Uncharacterized protein n=1 Tax=Bursaphelenchus okinawaensis TaxID=465554 RepID=A0A811K3N0_9BILA|nr:unnamed protein product [Bursaphelenchus okinawaensis]CAG9089945.1 unnamed protein product [Bursaphelenchus okinawaensis]
MNSLIVFGIFLINYCNAGLLTIVNQCVFPVVVVKTVPGGTQTAQCTLAAGGECTQTFTDGAMNFRNGFGPGHTIAEFSFGSTNPDGNDNYALNVIEGFDIAMQIIPQDGCHVAECDNAACPDAYHSSADNHTYGVPDGTPFILNLCNFDAVTGLDNCAQKTTTTAGPVSTSLTINNKCNEPVTVVKTVIGGTQTTQCQLAVDASCTQSYTTGVMNFRDGYGHGHTIAEFSFGNSNGNTNYALNVIEGYDIAMQIIPEDGGHVAECGSSDCTDAYHSSTDNRTYGVPAGNPMVLNLCEFEVITTTTAAPTTTATPTTNLTITNECTQAVTVVKTVSGGTQTVQCQLAAGASCSQTYTTGVMNFRNGYGNGHTIAEFSFGNSNGNSNYDLNVIEGYDIAMQIVSGNGGHTAECNSASCTDAYHSSSDNKTYGVPTGNPLTLNLCYLGS